MVYARLCRRKKISFAAVAVEHKPCMRGRLWSKEEHDFDRFETYMHEEDRTKNLANCPISTTLKTTEYTEQLSTHSQLLVNVSPRGTISHASRSPSSLSAEPLAIVPPLEFCTPPHPENQSPTAMTAATLSSPTLTGKFIYARFSRSIVLESGHAVDTELILHFLSSTFCRPSRNEERRRREPDDHGCPVSCVRQHRHYGKAARLGRRYGYIAN
jgi:hypothetical protein